MYTLELSARAQANLRRTDFDAIRAKFIDKPRQK